MARQERTEATRIRLLTAALDLFGRQGYAATSVAQIAAAAGVSAMTFFRHFPSKESVVLNDPFDPLIAAAIARQPGDLPPLVRAVRGVRESWHDLPASVNEEVRARIRIVAGSASLRSSMHRYTAATERVIAGAIGGDAFAARITAAALMAALSTALLEWSVAEGADLGRMVDGALDALVVDRG